jgi:hypothetical protein
LSEAKGNSMRRLLPFVLLAAAPMAGCYRYLPAPDAPSTGSEVRALLTTPINVPLAQVTANNVSEVEGEVAVVRADTVYISATRLVATTGFDFLGNNETVAVPRASIGRMELRRVDSQRTGLAIGLAVVLALAAQLALGEGVFGSEGRGGGGGQGQ